MFDRIYRRLLRKHVHRLFFEDLLHSTHNFRGLTWLGSPIWQNTLDLWNIQEVIAAVNPQLLIETGTNRGGSSMFFAHLMDLMKSNGEVVTIDLEKMHDLSHPRITYMLGSAIEESIAAPIRAKAAACTGPVMVILDSDHSAAHVLSELRIYAPLVTRGSYCMVQDGVIDTLPMFSDGRPGPLKALEDYLLETSDFEIDHARCERFLITHHPKGWLRRIR